MSHETQVFDLGFAMARLEEADDNASPMVTIVTPNAEEAPGQTIMIGSDGIEGLLALAHRLRYWNEKPSRSPIGVQGVQGEGPNYSSEPIVLTPPA